jgi:hypothetical protein
MPLQAVSETRSATSLAGQVPAKQMNAGQHGLPSCMQRRCRTSRTYLQSAVMLLQHGDGALWPACRCKHAGVASIWETAAIVCTSA